MQPMGTNLKKNGGITRRQLMSMALLGMANWMLAPIGVAEAALQDDLELVSLIPTMAGRDGPLLVLRDFETDPDREVEAHLRLQLGQRNDLLAQLKKKIGFENQMKLSVEEPQVRLLYVPQLQEGCAAAYHRYCRDITDYLFEMSRADNFYAAITSPKQSYPPINKNGVTAFLVHRLAKEYRVVCRFTAESGRSAAYKATGAIFSNHLGAVDLQIQCLAPGRFDLTRKPFTVWQNNAVSLHALMSVPVEETLHYLLGTATDREIAEALRLTPPESLATAKHLADEWMALEESVVGGLVNRVLERYCERHRKTNPLAPHGVEGPALPSLPQYRYRAQGIQLVQQLGYRKAMALYMDSPSTFRDELFRHQDA